MHYIYSQNTINNMFLPSLYSFTSSFPDIKPERDIYLLSAQNGGFVQGVSERNCIHFQLTTTCSQLVVCFDLLASLLTLGSTQASLILLSLNRSLLESGFLDTPVFSWVRALRDGCHDVNHREPPMIVLFVPYSTYLMVFIKPY